MAANLDRVAAWKISNDANSKQELLSLLQNLDSKGRTIERDVSRIVAVKRDQSLGELTGPLLQLEQDLKQERKSLRSALAFKRSKIKDTVGQFRVQVGDVKPTPEFVTKMKVLMEEIENLILAFKEEEKTNFDDLLKEERFLTQEITAFDKKIDIWKLKKEPNVTVPKIQSVGLDKDIRKDLPEEVAAFESFVQKNGGRCGGWEEFDHQTFLRVRDKYKGKISFIDEAVANLPTKNLAQVQEHEEWFHSYQSLLEKKKEAIQKWKEAKRATGNNEDENGDDDEADSEEEREKLQEEKRRQQVEKDRERRVAQLAEWKSKKEEEKALAAKLEGEKEVQRLKKLEKERKKQELLRLQVEEYRAAKELEQMEQEQLETQRQDDNIEEKEFRQLQARLDSARIRERNYKMEQEKLARKQLELQREEEKAKRLEKIKSNVRVNVKRDPSRLTRLTAGWKERLASEPSSTGQVVTAMPHKAIPSWRQGLN